MANERFTIDDAEDEIMVQCITSNYEGRLRSHRLLAEELGLNR